MKKILYSILATVLGLFCFVGCTNVSTGNESTENAIQFVEKEVTLSVGTEFQAEVVVSKKNVYVFWSIRDENVATVSSKGVITAVAEGQTICYAKFGGHTAICLVTVTKAESGKPVLAIATPYEKGLTLYAGDSFAIRANIYLGNELVQDADLTYSVSDAAILDAKDGTVFALAQGEGTVTITAAYDGQTASLEIPVQIRESAGN